MPLIRVLSDKKRLAYESAPLFSAQERKHFFALPIALKKRVDTFPSTANKVGFRLLFGYFLATKQFYPADAFHEKDIQYLCNQYNLLPFAFDVLAYKGSTYTRHRQLILSHFAFQAYQAKVHHPLIEQAIKEQIYSWETPERIFDYILEWLVFRRIELPTYHNIQHIITYAIRERDQAIKLRFSQLLQDEHRKALDRLLEKQTDKVRAEYVFKKLQSLSPSDAPTQIRNNIAKLEIVQSIFEIIYPTIKQLGINDNAIQHFGNLLQNFDSSNLIQKAPIDRYFHLALFCIYQRYIFEDWMMRTFVSVCKLAINRAKAKEKERLFEERNQRRKAFQQVMSIAENSSDILEKVRTIAWMDIPATHKETQLQQLLPLQATAGQANAADKGISRDKEDLQQIKQSRQIDINDNYYTYLREESQSLQQRASPILKKLSFHPTTKNEALLQAIQHFRTKQGVITKSAPTDFLSKEERTALVEKGISDKDGKFRVSLYKILLFQQVSDAINRGSLNLRYTYKYKDMEEFLIPKADWDKDKNAYLDRANLTHLKAFKNRMDDYKKMLHHHYQNTNDNILSGQNKFFRKSKKNNYHVITPKVDKLNEDKGINLFPAQAAIPLSEVLATVEQASSFLEHFEHLQPLYRKQRPDKSLFFAGITAYGCNLGLSTMAKSVSQIRASQLEQTTNWYFSLEHINKANAAIANFSHQLPMANLYRKEQKTLRTSSDGQKIKLISTDTIFGSYSSKYYRKGKGVVAYSFVDERYIPFYSLIIDASIREATFVLDGLLHNEVIKSTIHTTDTHGYTEAVFGLMDLLGFGFAPNIAKMLNKTLYTFKEHSIPDYRSKGYVLLPKGYIDVELIENNWDDILRLLTSLKLKYCTASQIFTRFNSYSKQHPLYAAIKEYGRMVKTLHILRFTDDLQMRQDSRKSGNVVEDSNRFSKAVFFANGGEMIFLTRSEQQIAEACKRLIKNAVICWNYIFLTRKVQQTKTIQQKQQLIKTTKLKTAHAWQHVFFTGTYDFSHETLADSFNLLHSQNYELNLE